MKKEETKKAPAKKAKSPYQIEDEKTANVVNDSAVAYTAILPNSYLNTVAQNLAGKVQAIKDMLQGNNKQASNITAHEKIDIINAGVSKQDLEFLKQKSGMGYDQLSQVLDVARATLINKKGDEKFSMAVSEKIVSLADIYSYGYEVFEDENRFNNWVFRPNQALGGRAPYSYLTNQYGREEVKNLIGRIDYGVYS